MASVYRARQTSLERDVTIKVINPDLAETADFVVRFRREACTEASLSYPFIRRSGQMGKWGI